MKIYKLSWIQPYVEWDTFNNHVTELALANSDMAESIAIIGYIMSL